MMANKIQLRQVERALVRDYESLLDLDDVKSADQVQRSKVLRTRALAAEAVRHAAGVDRDEAAASVTDGSRDNGLDAVHVDLATSRITLVQAKWHDSGTGTIGAGDTHAFIQGFKDLTDEAFHRFNLKVQALAEETTEALTRSDLIIHMVIVTSGGDELAPEVKELVDDLQGEMNHDSEMVLVSVWGIEYLRARLAQETIGARINLTGVQIDNWGMITEPYQAYYGIVDGHTLKDWYGQHGDSLFSQNIRKALGSTAVNSSLHATAIESPSDFWYFNNGVTVLCDKVAKRAKGASSRSAGEFDLDGASIVNGAQTVASLAGALADTLGATAGDSTPKVWIRVISLEGCPPGFAAQVTRATNTQNSVESRDFVSLDDEQLRLRMDFRLSLNKTYSIKRGDAEPAPSDGCTVIEAATALACMQNDISLAVIAKSAPGRLWDMQGRYYRHLFNPGTNPYAVWRAVQTMRWVDTALDSSYKILDEGRPRAVNTQGRRVVLWGVFRQLALADISDPAVDWESRKDAIVALANSTHDALFNDVETLFSTNYVTSLFKNASRCRDLGEALRSRW